MYRLENNNCVESVHQSEQEPFTGATDSSYYFLRLCNDNALSQEPMKIFGRSNKPSCLESIRTFLAGCELNQQTPLLYLKSKRN